jgi:hypothetical protein
LVIGAYLRFVIWDLEFDRNVVIRFALCALPILLILASVPTAVLAQGLIQGISGSWESNYSFLSSKTTDASGNTVKTDTQFAGSRFQLDINTKIFPNLRLRAGGIAEGTWSVFDDKTNDIVTRTTVLDFRPYIDLTLETPLYTASVGYIRRQQRVEVFDLSTVTLINNEYYAILGWRPEGLPSIDAQIRRRDLYDSDKSFRDIKEDFISLNPKYQYEGLRLDYYGTYLHSRDDLTDLDVTQYTHSGRASYANSFFNNRVAINTNYNILYQETETKTTGSGFVSAQAFPNSGLSRIDDTLPPAPLTLDANPNLIDGNTTARAGIDLVADVPLVRRQMGLDFLIPTEVNQLLIWVDRELTATIAGSFTWDVFISEDNSVWTHWAGPTAGTFGPFQNRFEINFSSVTTRYIKVVTTPLLRSPLVPPNIFVTELQAFLRTPAADVKGKTSRTTHIYDLDVKTRILDNPSLFYELYYYLNREEPSGRQRYDLINSLYANHRFNEVFSGRAKVGIENGKELDEKRLAYVFDAAVTADPLRTLHHSLVFNGREEEIGGRPNNTNSIILYNTAQLYKGVDINLYGGVIFTKQESGEKGRDFLINFQTNIVPHRAMTLGINYLNTISRRTGGDQGSSSTYRQTLDFNLSYNPFRTLNLFAFVQYVNETGQEDRILQNYSINWSPFPDGALQFTISYNENYRTEDHLVERIFQPTIRYNFSKRSYVDLSYQFLRSRSDIQKIDSNLLSTSLKIFY